MSNLDSIQDKTTVTDTETEDFAAGFTTLDADDTAVAAVTLGEKDPAEDHDAAVKPAPAATQDVDYKALYETGEARFKSLKGKYDSEVPILHAKVRDLEGSRARQTEPAKADTQTDDDELPAEVQAIIDDMPTVAKAVDALVRHRTKKLLAPIEAQVQPMVKKSQDDAVTQHFGAIAKAHSDWEAVVNGDPFKAWKGALPGYRRAGADQVLDGGSADEVVGLIGDFKKESGLQTTRDNDDDDLAVVGRRSGGPKPGAAAEGDKNDFSAGFNIPDPR